MTFNILHTNKASKMSISATKQHKIKVAVLATCLLFSNINSAISTTTTQNNRSTIKRESKITDFNLKRDITIYSITNSEGSKLMCKRVAELLKKSGCEEVSIAQKPGEHTINIEQVEKIAGADKNSNDAYSLKVFKNEVNIEYTSSKSMSWAFQALRNNIVSDQKALQKIFDKSTKVIKAADICKTSGDEGSSEIIDLIKTPMSISMLQSHINKAVMNNKFVIYLKLISTEGTAIKSDFIDSANPYIKSNNKALSYSELNQLYKTATDNGIELIPILDISSNDNIAFEKHTGHKIHSTEGVRFTKVLTKEFAKSTNFDVVYLGNAPTDTKLKEKYFTPLAEIFKANNKSVITDMNR